MGHRISKVYTKTGDQGISSLDGKNRLAKCDPAFAVVGDLDELNCALGLLAVDQDLVEPLKILVMQLQQLLFNMGAEWVLFDAIIKNTDVSDLEAHIDHYNSQMAPLKEFILPGGNALAAKWHMARSICRRAERSVVAYMQDTTRFYNPCALQWLNRLSDFLFVMARFAMLEDHSEIQWHGLKKPKES